MPKEKLILVNKNNGDHKLFYLKTFPSLDQLKSDLKESGDKDLLEKVIVSIKEETWNLFRDRENNLDMCGEYPWQVGTMDDPCFLSIECYHKIEIGDV